MGPLPPFDWKRVKNQDAYSMFLPPLYQEAFAVGNFIFVESKLYYFSFMAPRKHTKTERNQWRYQCRPRSGDADPFTILKPWMLGCPLIDDILDQPEVFAPNSLKSADDDCLLSEIVNKSCCSSAKFSRTNTMSSGFADDEDENDDGTVNSTIDALSVKSSRPPSPVQFEFSLNFKEFPPVDSGISSGISDDSRISMNFQPKKKSGKKTKWRPISEIISSQKDSLSYFTDNFQESEPGNDRRNSNDFGYDKAEFPKLIDLGKVDKNVEPYQISRLDYLSDTICDLYEKVAQTRETLLKKLQLRDLLYEKISPCFETSGLYIVGSSLNGFGNEKSDMDLCLMITEMELDQKTDAINVLKVVQMALNECLYTKTCQLIEAKVPILRIQFNEPFEGITVDLNANNSVAIKNTHLLFYYAFSDWRIRPLVMIVKEWAKRCNINNASQLSFTSYSLVLMIIHYLQCGLNKPVIPSLQQFYPKRFTEKIDIRELNLSVPLYPQPHCQNFDSTLGELLIGFFLYYAQIFDYEKNVISIRLGKSVERSAVIKNNGTQWSPIVIEEPFTHSNTAHSIFDQNVFEAIKLKFQEAYDILNETRDINELLSVKPYQSPYFIP